MKDTQQLIAEAEMTPCVGVCKMDPQSGWCFGCGRTEHEIDQWQAFDDATKTSLEERLPERVKSLIDRRRSERGARRPSRRPSS
ncbi:DUF1289 domain-containing protein [Sedimenticola sp.]|uniref:DUF1289 domain-containing protein n=1 Tax=Sedimenticola sp. TaxID=1940285 RepID=UPI003D0C9251